MGGHRSGLDPRDTGPRWSQGEERLHLLAWDHTHEIDCETCAVMLAT